MACPIPPNFVFFSARMRPGLLEDKIDGIGE